MPAAATTITTDTDIIMDMDLMAAISITDLMAASIVDLMVAMHIDTTIRHHR
jgi:hypothetical protein